MYRVMLAWPRWAGYYRRSRRTHTRTSGVWNLSSTPCVIRQASSFMHSFRLSGYSIRCHHRAPSFTPPSAKERAGVGPRPAIRVLPSTLWVRHEHTLGMVSSLQTHLEYRITPTTALQDDTAQDERQRSRPSQWAQQGRKTPPSSHFCRNVHRSSFFLR